MSKITYSEKLKDPRWQRKRLEIMQRDNFTCKICCSETKTLNIHHKSYKGDPWEQCNDQLVILCEDCHSTISIKHPMCGKYLTHLHCGYSVYFIFEHGFLSMAGDVIEFIPKNDFELINKIYDGDTISV